jgi:ABC-type nitrate/sulfonate/bicarbonate transport system permease component
VTAVRTSPPVQSSTSDRMGAGPSVWSRISTPRMASILFLLTWLTAWEVAGRFYGVRVSHPTAIAVAAYETIVVENRILPALLETLNGLSVGYLITVVLGIPIGFAMGRSRIVEVVLEPYITALYSTPRIALIPLLVIWAGIGYELRVTVVVLSAIFPLIINTYKGSQQIDQDYIDVGRAFCASRRRMLTTVIFPASMPYLMAGLRLAMGRALIGIMTAEMAAAVTGTGALIISYGRYLQIDRLLVPIIVLGGLAILLQKILATLERRSSWRTVESG